MRTHFAVVEGLAAAVALALVPALGWADGPRASFDARTWTEARENWRQAARAIVDGDLDAARPADWAKAAAIAVEAGNAADRADYAAATQKMLEAARIAQALRAQVVTERNAARVGPVLQMLDAAYARKDRFAAEVFLATLEELIPAERRLTEWRKKVEGLPTPVPLGLALGEKTALSFARIPSGRFVMGSSQGPTFRFKDVPCQFDAPPHEVKLRQAFLMSRCKVTQGQWKALLKDLPADCPDLGDDYPVYFQKMDETQRFLKALHERYPDSSFALPTEEQWEHACRGGSGSEYYFGLDGSRLDEFEWSACFDVRPKGPMPVGKKQPNAFGLYDMAGNVMEWCSEIYRPYPGNPVPAEAVQDPVHPAGPCHVVRGACWASPFPEQFRSSCRHPSHYGMGAGFRVVIVLDVPSPGKPAAVTSAGKSENAAH